MLSSLLLKSAIFGAFVCTGASNPNNISDGCDIMSLLKKYDFIPRCQPGEFYDEGTITHTNKVVTSLDVHIKDAQSFLKSHKHYPEHVTYPLNSMLYANRLLRKRAHEEHCLSIDFVDEITRAMYCLVEAKQKIENEHGTSDSNNNDVERDYPVRRGRYGPRS